MTTASPGPGNNDPTCVDCEPDKCDEIRQTIRDILYGDKPAGARNNELLGLQYRYGAQRYGKTGPMGIDPNADGGWESHNNKIQEQKKHLDREIKKFEDENCKDPPNGTYSFQQMELPDPSVWVGPEPGLQSADGIFSAFIPGLGAAKLGASALGGIGKWLGAGGGALVPAM